MAAARRRYGTPMACARRGESWLRGIARVMRRPETALLALLGLGLLVTGVLIDASALVVGVGPGLMSLAVLLSLVEEFKIGVFWAKFRTPDREHSFEEYMELHKPSLRRLAADLGARRPAPTVADALTDSYEHWEDGAEAFRRHVLCRIVHKVVGPDPQGEPFRKALRVLVGRGYEPGAIAMFLAVSVDRVQQELADLGASS